MYRHHPSWGRAGARRRGRIGRLTAVQSWFSYFNDDPANIRNILDFGGGALFDIGCYSVNLSRMLFDGEPTGVQARSRRDPASGVDVLTSAILDFEGGHRDLHVLDPGRVRPAGPHLRHRGADLDRDPVQHPARPADAGVRHRRRRPSGRAGHGGARLRDGRPVHGRGRVVRAAVLDDEPTPVPPEDAVANLRVIERIFAGGRRIRGWRSRRNSAGRGPSRPCRRSSRSCAPRSRRWGCGCP